MATSSKPLGLILAAGLVACSAVHAPRPAPAPSPLVVFDPDAAMRQACLRKLTGQSPMTPAWRAWCKARGLTLAQGFGPSSDRPARALA